MYVRMRGSRLSKRPVRKKTGSCFCLNKQSRCASTRKKTGPEPELIARRCCLFERVRCIHGHFSKVQSRKKGSAPGSSELSKGILRMR